MICPILPAGAGVDRKLQSVPAEVEMRLRAGLQAAGYQVPVTSGYTPELAMAIYRWQQDHPLDAGADFVLSQTLRGPNGAPLSVVSCPTYRALGVPCEQVQCQSSIVQELFGSGAAEAVCANLHRVLRLDCGAAPTPGQQPAPGIQREPNPWPMMLILGAMAWYYRRQRK